MAKMSEQTKQEFKDETIELAMILFKDSSYSTKQMKEIKRSIEFVFEKAHIRGEYDERNR